MPTDTPDVADFEEIVADQLEAEQWRGSHTELDDFRFHASSVGYDPRKMVLSKFGLEHHDASTLGTFKVGSLIHEWMEGAVENADLGSEEYLKAEVGDVLLTGQADVVDEDNGVIFDFKTRSSWYKFDPPIQRHIDQVLCYMWASGSTHGQIVYVSKGDLEVRTWPEDGAFAFTDHLDDWRRVVEKTHYVSHAIRANGIPASESQIYFDKGDSWISQQEHLAEWVKDDGDTDVERPIDGLEPLADVDVSALDQRALIAHCYRLDDFKWMRDSDCVFDGWNEWLDADPEDVPDTEDVNCICPRCTRDADTVKLTDTPGNSTGRTRELGKRDCKRLFLKQITND